MNVVVLGYSNVLTAQVFGAIHERHSVSAVIDVAWEPAPKRGSRLSQLIASPVATLQQKLDRRVDNWQHGRQMECIAGMFSGHQRVLPDVPTYSIGSRQLHSPASLDLIASLSPDILLVTHAPLLKPVLYQLPTIATLNIHWGIAPQYCGQHTFFWPLYYRDFHHLGITIHRIDDGIDTGPMLAQGAPRIEADDDEGTIWARCASVATELSVRLLAAAEAGDPLLGKRIIGTPRLFRRSQRRASHTLRYWLRRKLWRERLPTLEAWQHFNLQPELASILQPV